MKRYLISGVASGLHLADSWIPGLKVRRSQSISSLFQAGLVAISVAAVLLLTAPSARAFLFGAYQFREIASTTGPFSSIGAPSINDSGTIAAVFTLDGGGQQVLTQQIIIADTTDPSQGFESFIPGSTLVVNNIGTVVFRAQASSGPGNNDVGIYAHTGVTGGLITKIVDDSGSFLVDDKPIDIVYGDFDFSDSGEVVFNSGIDYFSNNTVGVFGRNVAGGPVYRRTTEADFSEFGFASPAVNSRGDFAVILSFGCCAQVTRQQIIGNLGTIMDTDDEFDIFDIGFATVHRIDMNNAGSVAFRAKLDSGDEGIFVYSDATGQVTPYVDTTTSFDSVSFPSINSSGTVAFLATFDSGGGKGIFNGPNPVTNKIIGVGDVFQTKSGATRTVTDVTGFSNDSLSKNGRVAFTVLDQFGEEYLISGARALLFDLEPANVAQLTTATDSKKTMMQDFGLSSFSPTQLTFDYRTLTPNAELIAYINNTEVGRVSSPGAMGDFAAAVIPINPLDLFGEFLPEIMTLTLELQGEPGTTIQLDNIEFATIANGDFSSGDLTGWRFDEGEGAAMVTNGLDLVFVPEPTAAALTLLNLLALMVAFGRRRP